MQSGPGIAAGAGGAVADPSRAVARNWKERADDPERGQPAGPPPVPFPPVLVPVPIPPFGGGKEASSRCRTPPPPSPGRPAGGGSRVGSGGAAPAGTHLAAARVPRGRCGVRASGGASSLTPRDYSPADSFHS